MRTLALALATIAAIVMPALYLGAHAAAGLRAALAAAGA